MMKITQRKIPVVSLASTKLDIGQIIGLAVASGNVHILAYDLPVTIAEKMQAEIPAWRIPASPTLTFVKNVQIKEGLLVVETEGPLTVAVKDVIDVIAAKLIKAKMISGFFPATDAARKQRTQYYYGHGEAINLRNATDGITNIRLMDGAANLLFTRHDDETIHMLATAKVDQPWTDESVIAHRFQQPVAFLGRVQQNKVDVVLKDGSARRATMGERATTGITQFTTLKQGITAIFGTFQVAGENFLAAIQGQNLVLVTAPSTSR